MNRAELRRLAESATKGATLERYRNGGGRLAIWGIPRELVADFFNERDREFYAAANPAAVLDMLNQLDAAEARLEAVRALAQHYDGTPASGMPRAILNALETHHA